MIKSNSATDSHPILERRHLVLFLVRSVQQTIPSRLNIVSHAEITPTTTGRYLVSLKQLEHTLARYPAPAMIVTENVESIGMSVGIIIVEGGWPCDSRKKTIHLLIQISSAEPSNAIMS